MNVTFLGTGTSHGVPQIDCMRSDYALCRNDVCRKAEHDPRHRRMRTSIIVDVGGKSILIDVSMDFRQQMLRENIRAIDAVLMTHAHADHIGGIPDIRSYTPADGHKLDFYSSSETRQKLRQSYDYIFNPDTFVGGGIPRIQLNEIDQAFEIFGCRIIPLHVSHGAMAGCFGYRINDLAYIPDIKRIRASEKRKLAGVKVLILDCLRIEREHSTHMILPESLALAREVAPQRCYFTHLCHHIDYESDSALLDKGMLFAWDGLRIEG
ncbi:MAG: MBL fold metallo-hydrolase [Chitinivibrionales bacterium]|nr:MBL fold metallo-hydrolase [Chitinivibrionales bacterium]